MEAREAAGTVATPGVELVTDELIPSERYTSQSWMDLEFERLWPKVWQMACREQDLRETGDYFEYVIGTQSILLVRVDADRIQAYRNSCLHRGTQLKDGTGNAGHLTCRYHGWRWSLDGEINGIPDRADFHPACVDRETLSLPQVRVDTWGGFVFVNFDPDAEPLLDFLGPIPADLARFEPENFSYVSHQTTILEANWKVALDAFNEPYHVQATHTEDLGGIRGPGADEQSQIGTPPPNAAGTRKNPMEFDAYEVHAFYGTRPDAFGSKLADMRMADMKDPRAAALHVIEEQKGIGRYHQTDYDYVANLDEVPTSGSMQDFLIDVRRATALAHGVDFTALSDNDVLGLVNWHVFPNMVGPINAGNWFLFRSRPNGEDPHTCLFDVFRLHNFGAEEPPPYEHEFVEDWSTYPFSEILLQDFANMPHVQRGMRQRSFPGSRLNRQETGIRQHQKVLSRYVGG